MKTKKMQNLKQLNDYKPDKKKELRISFCPKCRSVNVKYIFGFGNIFGVIPKMKCLDCNYTNGMFPQGVFNKDKLEKENKKIIKKKKIKSRKKRK